MALSKIQMAGIVLLLSFVFSPGLFLTLPGYDETLRKFTKGNFASGKTNKAAMCIHAGVIALLFWGIISFSDYALKGFPSSTAEDIAEDTAEDTADDTADDTAEDTADDTADTEDDTADTADTADEDSEGYNNY